MAKVERWRFTVTRLVDGKVEEVGVVEVTAKRPADVLGVLGQLRAPVKVIGHVRHNGVGMVQRFCWSARGRTVIGVRL